MIPKHRCTPYCDPDEGIHCIPDTYRKPNMTIDFEIEFVDDGDRRTACCEFEINYQEYQACITKLQIKS